MNHFTEIILDGDAFLRYKPVSMASDEKVLTNLAPVNIFVGGNNSGKSRFLRDLLRTHPLTFTPATGLSSIENLRSKVIADIEDLLKPPLVDVNGLKSLIAELRPLNRITENNEFLKPLRDLLRQMESIKRPENLVINYQGYQQPTPEFLFERIRQIFQGATDALKGNFEDLPKSVSFKRVYIPTLRGLRPLGDPGVDVYAEATRRDYNEFKNASIFTGQTLYEGIKKLLLGNLQDRKIVEDFQRFLSEAFFEGQAVALIPKYDSKGILDVKIGFEKEYPIHYLGDGIQSIIIMTFPLFTSRGERLLVGIEEPELFLHPGLQRLLLRTFLRPEFSGYQYFLVTHSNHFLDLTLDLPNISIYTFRKKLDDSDSIEKEAEITIENVSNDDSKSLQLLGVQNSAVFLSNCTIWVEGITDRRYLACFVKLYIDYLMLDPGRNGKRFKEGKRQAVHRLDRPSWRERFDWLGSSPALLSVLVLHRSQSEMSMTFMQMQAAT